MKSAFRVAVVVVGCGVSAWTVRADDYKLEAAGPPPQGLPAATHKLLGESGFRITSSDGPLCEVWLVKTPAQKAGFAPSLRVKYPYDVGALVGVLKVGENGEVADFRDQVLLPGLYTLRYGQQPQDGNHLGTSQQADFLLALPAEDDKAAAPLSDVNELQSLSAEAAGSAHPAIFSLLTPTAEKPADARLTHDADHDFWILETPGSDTQAALRLVLVGVGEE